MPRERKIAQLGLEKRPNTFSATGELIFHPTGTKSCAVYLPNWLSLRREDFGQRHVITQEPKGNRGRAVTVRKGRVNRPAMAAWQHRAFRHHC